jgi:pimeloyl-ACP methyl ester carboxylesterase
VRQLHADSPKSRQPGVKAPLEDVGGLKAPVLAFFGRKDAFIPIVEVDEFRDALKKAESVEISASARE